MLSPMNLSIADDPIETRGDDQLGRHDFVQRVIQLLHGVRDATDSTVVGLVGPWGSGKTSVINLVIEDLTGWEVRRLNPWSAADLEALLGEFFGAIVRGLPKQRSDAARKALLTCAEIAMPALSTVPLVGRGAEAIARKHVERLADDGTWVDRFSHASEQLRRLERPILMVIDDVDRLQPDELASLFKAVRLLGRFPNVHYLVAYDEKTIIDALCQSAIVGNDPLRAQAFLEKIVQLPLSLPTVPSVRLETLFNDGLALILDDNNAPLAELDRQRFLIAYQVLMSRTITQLRLIRRYLAQVAAYLPLVGPGEVDVVDFLILMAVRQSFPRLFRELPMWKLELTRTAEHNVSSSNIAWAKRLSNLGVPPDLLEQVRDTLILLFPKVDINSTMATTGRGGSGKQVSDPDYFDRYFAYAVPLHDVPDGLVAAALSQAAVGEDGGEISKVREILARPRDTSHEEKLVLLRKLDTLSRELPDESLADLISLAVECFQTTTDDGRLIGSEFHSCRTWLSHLVVRGAQSDRPPAMDETFKALSEGTGIRAMAEILDEASEGPRPPEPWLAELIALAAKEAMATIERHLEKRIEGDPPAVQSLLRFIAAKGEDSADIRSRIVAGLESGRWSISTVAAAFVEVVYPSAGGEPKIADFAQKDFLRLLPYEVVRSNFDREEPINEEHPNLVVDPTDTSFENRRQLALRHLREMRRVDEKVSRRESAPPGGGPG
jgi:hypothetical protein